MIEGDRIRDQRQLAEGVFLANNTFEAHINFALWVIAEQLYEIRRGLEIAREPINSAANSRGEKI